MAALHQWFLTMVPMEDLQILIALIAARTLDLEVAMVVDHLIALHQWLLMMVPMDHLQILFALIRARMQEVEEVVVLQV